MFVQFVNIKPPRVSLGVSFRQSSPPCARHENKEYAQSHSNCEEYERGHGGPRQQQPAHKGFLDPRPIHPGVFTKSPVCGDDVELILVRDKEVGADCEGNNKLDEMFLSAKILPGGGVRGKV